MKMLDRVLQNWRIDKVRPYLRSGGRVLDIGCADGALFRRQPDLGVYIGMDPALKQPLDAPPVRLIRGLFPDDLPRPRCVRRHHDAGGARTHSASAVRAASP